MLEYYGTEVWIEDLVPDDYTLELYDVNGNWIEQIMVSTEYQDILDYEKAGEEHLQFSDTDKIYVLPFSSRVYDVLTATNREESYKLINDITSLYPDGGTNIYGCAQEALRYVDGDSDEYSKTVILMTDGQSNYGSFADLEITYKSHSKIPIYSIMFGSADESELKDIANLTNAKVFDGRKNLMNAFKEVRSYN